MATLQSPFVSLGATGLKLPRVVFGTSCLGNLYRVVPDDRKQAIISEIFRHAPHPVVLDTAGKYGAGLALESIGRALRTLRVPAPDCVISNKLGWYRTPLKGSEPTFEKGVWAGLAHDAELRMDYAGIRQCYEQGRELLGPDYATQLVSLHDPDEYLLSARTPAERQVLLTNLLGAYQALHELKAEGLVKAVGIGAKDWRVIREITEHVELDWVMFACSLTVRSHPRELLELIARLHARGIAMINSAVFHAGFLTGGQWFDYRLPDPKADAALFRWRENFLGHCQRFGVLPANACVQFGFALPGIASVALNTERPERIQANLASATAAIPVEFWSALKAGGLIEDYYPLG